MAKTTRRRLIGQPERVSGKVVRKGFPDADEAAKIREFNKTFYGQPIPIPTAIDSPECLAAIRQVYEAKWRVG